MVVTSMALIVVPIAMEWQATLPTTRPGLARYAATTVPAALLHLPTAPLAHRATSSSAGQVVPAPRVVHLALPNYQIRSVPATTLNAKPVRVLPRLAQVAMSIFIS